jgi:hypothetical protein
MIYTTEGRGRAGWGLTICWRHAYVERVSDMQIAGNILYLRIWVTSQRNCWEGWKPKVGDRHVTHVSQFVPDRRTW